MDIMTLQRRLAGMGKWTGIQPSVGSNNKDAAADRMKDVVKRVNAKRPISNKWGGKDYPIDVTDYGQFISALETLSWVMQDMGFSVHYLTRSGLSYEKSNLWQHPSLFEKNGSAIIAMVAIGKDGNHYRISRDDKTLRIRSFNDVVRVLAPMKQGDTSGTKPISVALVNEIMRMLKRNSTINPKDEKTLVRWARLSTSLKPVTGGMLKTRIKMEFRKVK